jgi:hypothetical protein
MVTIRVGPARRGSVYLNFAQSIPECSMVFDGSCRLLPAFGPETRSREEIAVPWEIVPHISRSARGF